MENSTDKNPKGRQSWTPLHLAAWRGHLDICEYICLKTGGIMLKNDSGHTPLDYAKQFNQTRIIEYLSFIKMRNDYAGMNGNVEWNGTVK